MMPWLQERMFLVALTLMIQSIAFAQDKFIEITGKVTDSKSGEPLPFASIRIHHRNSGTLTNTEGRFLFKVAETQLQDSIEISFIGYASSILPFNSIRDYTIISLTPAVSILNEVTVSSKNGLDLVKEMLLRIPLNHDTVGKKLQAYYREDINLGKDSVSYVEAVVDIYKSSYTKKTDKDQLNILKGRRRKLSPGRDPLRAWLGGLSNGAGNSLGEDIIKNRISENNPLDPKNFKYYNFKLTDILNQGKKSIYVISLTPSAKAPRSKLTLVGQIFLNAESLALEKMDWRLSPAGIRYVNRHRNYGYRIAQVAYQMSMAFTGLHEVITFSELNNKWYLKEVRKEFIAKVNSAKRNLKDAKWKAETIFAVTHVAEGTAEPWDEKDNIIQQRSSVGSLISGHDNDKTFWENYNVVEPVFADTVRSAVRSTGIISKEKVHASNREHRFTRADTLQGKLTPLRSCYDVLFYHLNISVDPPTKFIKGNTLIRFKVLDPFTKIQVDLYSNMKIDSISFKDRSLSYTREFNAVYVDFQSTQPKGAIGEIEIYYHGQPKEPDFSIPMNGGFLWSEDKNGKPWIQSVCQGSGASLWWPNKDHLSDEPDSARITVNVPAGLTDISNGVLRSKRDMPDQTTTFDWYVSYPINNYNIAVNVGDYMHFGERYSGVRDTFDIKYYCLTSSEAKATALFKNVAPMVKLYEKDFGPYPFSRDGFTLMESLYPMEHQGAVSIGKIDTTHDVLAMEELQRLMWHESAHEWWGNNVSIKDMADFWFHEAFATYAEALCIENKLGYEASSGFMNEQQIQNKVPIIGVRDVNHIFYDLGDIYNKGCLMLNTLRHVVNNDTVWFNMLRGLQKNFGLKTVTSAEIEAFIGKETKTDYAYFFDQYLRFPAPPKLVVKLKKDGPNTVLKYKWQADVKNFRMPIRVTTAGGKFEMIYPTTTFKTSLLKNFNTEDFEVDQNDFYVLVELE